ncbi:MAG: type VI secretion system baseplate subunit TssF [Geobacteraceae bacterium]|nr:type VI secretion system baseplate subunit TssF [Geobacteraceae bacterium]
MNRPYFTNELFRLSEVAADFAGAFPALAPLLGGPMEDPDVERFLEGTAFKIGLLREKLNKVFPDIVCELTQLLFPHYLLPFPAATIVAFSPAPSFPRQCTVHAGTEIAAVPVDGTSCRFSTIWDVEVHPLQLAGVTFCQQSLRNPVIKLSLQLSGLALNEWKPGNLRLFLSGEHVTAADLFMVLRRHLKNIVIEPETGGKKVVLSPDFLRPIGFESEETLAPYPSHAFPGYRLLREMFHYPEKYLFFELRGWERWEDRGDGSRFSVSFELDSNAFVPMQIRRESFALFAVPASNIFAHEADPVLIDRRAGSYLLRPVGKRSDHLPIYSVDRVTGFSRKTGRERVFLPPDLLRADYRETAVYHAGWRKSLVHGGHDVYLSVAYPPGLPIEDEEVLSVGLTCTNGSLAGSLRVGDIAILTGSLPEGVAVRNITPVIPAIFPQLEPDLHRRFGTHLSLNCLSLATAGNLGSLLDLYLFPGNRMISAAADRKRISGIEKVSDGLCARWVNGTLMSGREIRIKARGDHFGGPGDMYFFGCLIDLFLGQCAAPNVFTVLNIEDTLKGDIYQWPPRLGRQLLA